MNTLGDTAEARARPSRWPVYVMSGMIGLLGLSFLVGVWAWPMMAYELAEHPEELQGLPPDARQLLGMVQQVAPYAVLFGVYGLFGIVTAIGVALFRSWSWWCAIVWGAGQFLGEFLGRVIWPTYRWDVWGILFGLAFYGFLVWVLATRRRLFFPPKPAGEE